MKTEDRPAPLRLPIKGWYSRSKVQENGLTELSAPDRTLMVGVDPSAESLAAAHYAVTAAMMRGGDVLLVHAFPCSIGAGR